MKQKNSSFFLLMFFLIGAGFLAFVLWPQPKPASLPSKSGQFTASSHQAQDLVNKHLWMTTRSQELAQARIQAQNITTSPRIGESIFPKKTGKSLVGHGVDLSSDSLEDQAFQDLNRYKKEYLPSGPDREIQGSLADEESRKKYLEAYREEYARQFIENARRHGYEVKLDQDFVVVSVKQIRKPSQDLGPQAQ